MDMLSQPCRALAIFAQMSKIPCTIVPVAIRKGENHSEEFLKLNPFGKVPVMVDPENNFVLTESVAIFRYMSQKHPNSLYPDGLMERAKVDEYMSWQHTNTRMRAAGVFITETFKTKIFGNDLEKSLKECDRMLQDLETMFIKDQKFIGGDKLTFADILCVCELMQPYLNSRDILQNNPKVAAYVQRVKESTQPAFDDAYKAFYKVQASLAKRNSKL